MALDGCGVVCKYIIFVFNVIFALVGGAFLGLGLWLRFSQSTRGIFDTEALNSSAFVIGVTVMIVMGIVFLVVVTFGDYGACSEKRCALTVFSVLLAILAACEVVIGVLAFSGRAEVGHRLEEFYVSLYGLYAKSGDAALGATLIVIHKMLQCCGVTGVPLIEIAKDTCPSPSSFMENFVMPSCVGVVGNVFERKASLVMGIFCGTGALLIVALICSTILNKQLAQAAAGPHYVILASPMSTLTSFQPAQHELVPTAYPDDGPVVFPPLTVANIPAANITVTNVPTANA